MRSKREIEVANIPACLTHTQQWVCWKYVVRKGIETKLPIDAKSLKAANVVDPASWCSFEKALATYQKTPSLDGVAFAFSKWDAFAGVDLDDCLDDDGEFIWGLDIVETFDSYCEVSPSGRGVKLIFVGKKPQSAGCIVNGLGPIGNGQIEIYDEARCFTITGQRLVSSPTGVASRQSALDALCAKLWPDKRNPPAPTPPVEKPAPTEVKQESLERMRACYKAILAMQLTDNGDGSHRLFSACCRCVEFDLGDSDAIRVVRKYANEQPFPTAWSNGAIAKRLRSAEKKVKRGSAFKQTPKVQLSLLSVGQLLRDNPELRPTVINGLLRTGETMNVIAPPKYGKSWLVTDLALAVSTGRKWLDHFDTVAGNVLILDNELHPETSANRIPKVADARGINLKEIANNLFVDNLRGRLQDILSLQSYFESLPKGFFKIIILDAFYRFLPKDSDENSNANMTDIYNRLDWYAAMLNCSFVLVHHASKGNQSGKSVTDVGAGAGSQARAADTHLILRQHEEDECVAVDAAVRSWHAIEPMCLRWSFPVWNIDDSLDSADLRPERPRRKPKPKEEQQPDAPKWTQVSFVESFVSIEPTTMKAIIAAAREKGITQRMARDMIQLTEGAGLIHRWTFGGNRPVKFATIPQPTLIGSEI